MRINGEIRKKSVSPVQTTKVALPDCPCSRWIGKSGAVRICQSEPSVREYTFNFLMLKNSLFRKIFRLINLYDGLSVHPACFFHSPFLAKMLQKKLGVRKLFPYLGKKC